MRLRSWLTHRRVHAAARGQSLVEFAIVLPFLLLLILGAIEFGFVFDSRISLQYASREGARVGSQLVNGGGALGCGAGGSPFVNGPPSVDEQIIAAVNRVITSSGSPLDVSRVTEIRLFLADAAGNEIPGNVNVWLPTPNAGPVVDGKNLDFTQSTVGWPACSRDYGPPADSIGVGVRYVYQLQTPFLAFTGVTNLPMYDTTIMAMNPTS